MEKHERLNFIKYTEKLITPEKVATVFKGADMLRKLPLLFQKRIMEKGSKKDPYIGFVVEPYSFFLAYEIVNEEKVSAMLPSDYVLENCSMFDGSRERKSIIIGAFNIHTSVFWGNRVEVYIIARNKKTGLLSWIIQEYESNTISYDPARGFLMPTTKHAVLTTSFLGELILDVEGKGSQNCIQATANLKKGQHEKLSKELWIDGNLSVDYGSELNDSTGKPFGLIFDPGEMTEALSIPLKDTEFTVNSFFSGLIKDEPFEVCCFPFAQHFYTTAMPIEHNIANEQDLEQKVREISSLETKASLSSF